MKKKILITQSNYIPWKGYFDAIALVDEFVIYDCVQYTKRDWRNRNRIKTPNGLKWLTIPVDTKGKFNQKIDDTKVSDLNWAKKHWETIKHNYAQAQHFKEFDSLFYDLYASISSPFLTKINQVFIETIMGVLDINTKLSNASDYELTEGQNEKLISICKQAKATDYYTGPAAKTYLNIDAFNQAGINVHFLSYEGYPQYPQLFGKFEHKVSIIDLLFNTGSQAKKLMKHLK